MIFLGKRHPNECRCRRVVLGGHLHIAILIFCQYKILWFPVENLKILGISESPLLPRAAGGSTGSYQQIRSNLLRGSAGGNDGSLKISDRLLGITERVKGSPNPKDDEAGRDNLRFKEAEQAKISANRLRPNQGLEKQAVLGIHQLFDYSLALSLLGRFNALDSLP